MQNFSPLALKLREKFEDDGWIYCKNAKFQAAPHGTKINLLFTLMKFPLHNTSCLYSFHDVISCVWFVMIPMDWLMDKDNSCFQ